MVCLKRLQFFKDCLKQFLLGPFLNTLAHIEQSIDLNRVKGSFLQLHSYAYGENILKWTFETGYYIWAL